MSSTPPKGKLTIDEILNKFPAVMTLVTSIQNAVSEAQIDGKLSGAELGGILAVAAPSLGKLVDEVIQDLQD